MWVQKLIQKCSPLLLPIVISVILISFALVLLQIIVGAENISPQKISEPPSNSNTERFIKSQCQDAILLIKADGDQLRPKVVYNPDDHQYLVVWQDNRNGNFEIYAELFNEETDCPPMRGGRRIGFYKGHDLINPDVIYRPPRSGETSGEYLIVWEVENDGDIRGMVLTTNGHPRPGILTNKGEPIIFGRSATPTVTYYNGIQGVYNIFVQRKSTKDETDLNIQLQRMVLEETAPWIGRDGNVLPIAGDESDQTLQPDAAFDPQNNIHLVVWEEPQASYDIIGQAMEKQSRKGSEFPIANISGDQRSPAITYHPNCHEYLVVFVDDVHHIKGQRVRVNASTSPIKIGGPISVTSAYTVEEPDIISSRVTSTGEYFVVWQKKNGINSYDIYGQQVSCHGDGLLNPPIRLSNKSDSTSRQLWPAVTYLQEKKQYFTVWSKNQNSEGLMETNFDLFARLVLTANVTLPPRVEGTIPKNGSKNIPITSSVTITFSKAMTNVSLTSQPVLTESTKIWTNSNQTLIYSLSHPMMPRMTYLFSITGTGIDELVIPEPYTWTFSTQKTISDYFAFMPIVMIFPPSPPINLVNGDFETNSLDGWTQDSNSKLPQTVVSAAEAGVTPNPSGNYVAQLGDPSLENDPDKETIPVGSSWIQQAFELPPGQAGKLTFYYRLVTYDGCDNPNAIDEADSFDVRINDELIFRDRNSEPANSKEHDMDWPITLKCAIIGTGQAPVTLEPAHNIPPSNKWRKVIIDLSNYPAEEQLTVRFEVKNTNQVPGGVPELDVYNTWVYIDGVNLVFD